MSLMFPTPYVSGMLCTVPCPLCFQPLMFPECFVRLVFVIKKFVDPYLDAKRSEFGKYCGTLSHEANFHCPHKYRRRLHSCRSANTLKTTHRSSYPSSFYPRCNARDPCKST